MTAQIGRAVVRATETPAGSRAASSLVDKVAKAVGACINKAATQQSSNPHVTQVTHEEMIEITTRRLTEEVSQIAAEQGKLKGPSR